MYSAGPQLLVLPSDGSPVVDRRDAEGVFHREVLRRLLGELFAPRSFGVAALEGERRSLDTEMSISGRLVNERWTFPAAALEEYV